jgi:hypothetical protein
MSPRWGSTPRWTDRLTVGRNVTLTLIEMIKVKAFRAFITVYSLFKSEPLSANIKLTLYKAQIRSIMTYDCSAWEFAADTHLMKLQRLQDKVLCTTGNFPRSTPVRILHTAFNLP